MLDVDLTLCRSQYTLTLKVVHSVVKYLYRLKALDTHVQGLLLHELTIGSAIVAAIHVGLGMLGIERGIEIDGKTLVDGR